MIAVPNIDLELDLAVNCLGHRLTSESRRRLLAAVADPCNETWDEANGINIGPKMLTLWQAVIAIDPTFPQVGPASTTDGKGRQLSRTKWSRVPSQRILIAALRYATH